MYERERERQSERTGERGRVIIATGVSGDAERQRLSVFWFNHCFFLKHLSSPVDHFSPADLFGP